jgi:type VI secretion system protein ImpH
VAELGHVKYPDGIERTRVTNAFMGLYGATSPLPTHYAEQMALHDYQGGPQPIREFFDVFHHRLLSLVYRTWTKYRFAVMYRKKGRDPFTRRMFCAIGLDGFREGDGVLDRFLFLRYAPLLANKSRSARGLEVVLADLFGEMGVRIEQFIGHWTLIEKPLRNKLGVMNSPARREPDHRALRVRRDGALHHRARAARLRRVPLVPPGRAPATAAQAAWSPPSPAGSTT